MSDHSIRLNPDIALRAGEIGAANGVSLCAAVVVSLGLWATIISAAIALV